MQHVKFVITNGMDIVSRLKTYMDYAQMAISQFADTCNIPRPTISQILNGRNKKISDELIGKIHAAFPDLSVLWLMFGEGPMLTKSNIKTSEPKKDNKLFFDDTQSPENEIFSGQHELFPEMNDFYPKKSETENSRETTATPDTINRQQPSNEIADALSGRTEPYKKITSIVVFYADNTFQTFNPSSIH